MRNRLTDIIKQCTCRYSPPCDGDCGSCGCADIYDKEIEYITDTILASGIIPVIGDDDTVCDHCSCVLLDQRDEARKEAERYKRYYFHHEYDKWEAEIKTATVLKMSERLKTYLREVADGEIGDGWIDQIAKEILEENNGNL